MKQIFPATGSVLSLAVASSFSTGAIAAEKGFIEDTTATLQARNYYFSRDYSDIVGTNPQSKAEEWAQGFILNVKSGYTQGTVGFGVDVIGLLGLRLDSSPDRVNTGLLPVGDDGRAPSNYSRLEGALKMRLENRTESGGAATQPAGAGVQRYSSAAAELPGSEHHLERDRWPDPAGRPPEFNQPAQRGGG